ncbi:hypothetical protein ASG04_07145 [Curtobacterium sp. Leaf183]|uniref:HAMP domain-containing sensor histidine kinase n=1 Tax=Curtobacterium sp. Leaf183 TaxID=1736291 RepID=UPI0006F7A419|nr:HAMP domain-containing sensor histidine kinase [Curtobacterium sp. Leaf183]KQS08726.1 hypothetical protein ASG04_07145 [Curtobacterium sp. Leaf183]
MRTRTGSLRRRLAALVAGAVALAGLLVAVLTGFVVTTQLHGALDTALQREATRVQRLLQTDAGYTGDAASECRYVVEPACAREVTRDDAVGSGRGPLVLTAAAHRVATGERASARSTQDGVRVLVVPVRDGEAVMVGLPLAQTEVAVRRTWIALAGAGALSIVLAAVLGYVVAAVGLRPIQSLDAAVRRVRDTADPHARVEVHRNDELGRLADAFDDMLARLAAASDRQRDFVADASHELRTPLTTLRTNLQLLGGDRALDPGTQTALRRAVSEELRAMQLTVDDLSELARGDRHDAGFLDSEDLVTALHEVADTTARRWDVSVTVHAADEAAPVARAPVVIASGRLRRLLDVVLDNAGKYGEGTPVDVRVRVTADTTSIEVTDGGIGIPPEDRQRVFDRFHRAASARGRHGSGLGLAIAAQICAASGGSVSAHAGPSGTGTTIRITLRSAGGPTAD